MEVGMEICGGGRGDLEGRGNLRKVTGESNFTDSRLITRWAGGRKGWVAEEEERARVQLRSQTKTMKKK